MKFSAVLFFLVFSNLAIMGCASKTPVLMKASDVTVLREEPNEKKCQNLGSIEGRTNAIHSTQEALIEDLKTEAIRKGANFVKVETMGAQASAIRGTAYFCK